MRLWLVIIVLVPMIAVGMVWHELKGNANERQGSLSSLIDVRTESNPEHTRVRVRGRLNSGSFCVTKVTGKKDGTALLLLIDSTLPFGADLHRTSSFDATFEIPKGVTVIRLGSKKGDVLWQYNDCLKRFLDRSAKWHCDEGT